MKRKTMLIFLFIALGLSAFVVLGVSNLNDNKIDTTKEYEVTSYITQDVIDNMQDCSVDLCLEEGYTPENLKEQADDIVIGSVISLDEGDPEVGLFGVTTGKLLINETLRGDLQKGQVIEYMKNGGVMNMAEWEDTQPVNANLKRAYLRNQAGVDIDLENTYINILISDDIEIEEGYTYLIYLKENNGKYEIIGLDIGLRKINVNYASKLRAQNYDMSTLQVMNNKTGEFESLQEYINTYINNSEE